MLSDLNLHWHSRLYILRFRNYLKSWTYILPGLETPIHLPIIVIRSLPRWNSGKQQAISNKVTEHYKRKRCACVWAFVSSPLASRLEAIGLKE